MKTVRAALLIVATSMAAGLTLNAMRAEPVPFTRTQAEPQVSSSAGTITLTDLRSAGDEVLFVDARTPLFHHRGRIPGSINISRKGLPESLNAATELLRRAAGRRIVVYCSGPSCMDADAVAEAIAAAGFGPVHVLREGFEAWVKTGLGEEAGS
jgi:rhodanese-related sulfurtransferase